MRDFLITNRLQLGMSQKKVAEKTGISRVFYSQLENGKRNPSVQVAKKIAAELHFDWNIFFAS